MADLIDRAAALDCFHDWVDRYGDVHTPDEMAEYRAIEELPSAQPEIIRCKDCKWYREGVLLSPNKFCYRLKDNSGKRIGYNFTDNDFCSRAERRADEHDKSRVD